MANIEDDMEIIDANEADETAGNNFGGDSGGLESEENIEDIVESDEIDLKLLKKIRVIYTDIIAEFADVEIFMISLDSLLLELLSHKYHNFEDLGGQTVVFAAQIDAFIRKLNELRAKFKLVAFTDFAPLYNKDTLLSFYYNFMMVYLQKHAEYSQELLLFRNPLDEDYQKFLYNLTPSFLLMSIENAFLGQTPLEIDFQTPLLSIAIHLISHAIPVVHFSCFAINFSTVMSFRTLSNIQVKDMEEKIRDIWTFKDEKDNHQRKPSAQSFKSTAEYLAYIVKDELKTHSSAEDFPELCAAAIMAALVGSKRGVGRNYLQVKHIRKGLVLIRLRRTLLQAIANSLARIDVRSLDFSVEDLWDGRLVLTIFEAIVGKEKILPFRIQQEFAEFHKIADLKVLIQTDEGDRLLDPPSPAAPRKLLIDDLELYSIDYRLIDEFVPEAKEIFAKRSLRDSPELIYEAAFRSIAWQFNKIEDRVITEEKEARKKQSDIKNLDARSQKRQTKFENRRRQKLFAWYQGFADSLGGDYLVDFTRQPKGRIGEVKDEATKDNKNDGGGQKKAGGKKEKEPKLTKAQLIQAANLKKKDEKQEIEEKNAIDYAIGLSGNVLAHLEEQFKNLKIDKSKAYCTFVMVQKLAGEYEKQLQKLDLEEKRQAAVELVGKIKDCFNKYWKDLDERQKDKLTEIWMSLGFEPNPKRRGNSLMNLEIDLVDYQLYYGGRLIDILSDPKTDDRATGFKPDKWQRDMIDAVDRNHSALIVAPTSAGKTFVSYYCIEKILRQSDDDVVVYVSPSMALSHQVCGSVYARYKNKAMSGNKVLFGTYTSHVDNVLNCQVLVILPENLEYLLTSSDPIIQAFVSKIRYVILDEVHCINAAEMANEGKGHIWEHLFLLIRCPFLALSATISNTNEMHSWLQGAEKRKALPDTTPRTVELIIYSERWSELELSLQKLTGGGDNQVLKDDMEQFCRDLKGVEADKMKKTINEENTVLEEESMDGSRTSTPALRESTLDVRKTLIKFFTPFSVFKPEKIRLFGIPGDQLLTARQIVELYTIMGAIDEPTKDEFDPRKYFKSAIDKELGGIKPEKHEVWLNRKVLREYEKALKGRFMFWLENNEEKSMKMFKKLEEEVEEEMEYRSKPFEMRNVALHNIVPLCDELKEKSMLPALCFNEDRNIIRDFAIRLFNELEKREEDFKRSPAFKKIYDAKAEAKHEKLMKRKRDEAEKKREKKEKEKLKRAGSDDEGGGGRAGGARDVEREPELDMEMDVFALQKAKLKKSLDKFKLFGPNPDEEMCDKTIERLLGKRSDSREDTKFLLKLIQRGIGYHYEGMNNSERGCIEILYRNGYLGIVFSTSTLALGMNMPCKTVIFGIDTNKLTPLQFRQMSGRAGRRGYDSAGNVIFMALPSSKIRRLLTASLATLRGNVPFTTSFLLRLFNYVNGWKDEKPTNSSGKDKLLAKKKKVDNTDTSNMEVRLKAALTLLDNCFALYTKDVEKRECMKRLLRYLTLFNVQLLRKEQLIDKKCELTGFAQVAIALSSWEPGNLMFVHVLQNGQFHKLVHKLTKADDAEENKKELKDTIVLVLAHIFTNKRLPISYNSTAEEKDDKEEYKPVLEPMPSEFQELVDGYNSNVDKLLLAFLQLASEKHHLQAPVIELTGKVDDSTLNLGTLDVVYPIDENLILDEKLIPSAARTIYDHRGKKIQMNSYAYDFWKNGSKEHLLNKNKLLPGEYWFLINNFSLLLIAIYSTLVYISSPRDKFIEVMFEIADEFEDKFKKAFKMNISMEEGRDEDGRIVKTKKWKRN